MRLGNFNETGGRQIHQDDLQILQSELYTAVQDQYKGSGAFILSGCLVSGTVGNYTIGAGLVYADGIIMKFDQVTGIASLPRYIHQATPLNQDSFTLELGGTAYKRTLYKSELVSSLPGSGEYITMTTTGGRTYNDVLATNFVRLSGNQTINGTKTFGSTIIGSINGNAATVTNGVYTNTNNTFAGSNTFSSTISGNINGNAATVTNGAYTNANNTFAGSNTFSNTVNANISGNAATATNATNATNAGNASTVTNGVYTNANNTLTGNNTFNNPITPSGGIKTTDGTVIKTVVYPIGAWNMQSSILTFINHGLDFTKIKRVSGVVYNDAVNAMYPDGDSATSWGVASVGSSQIVLGRASSLFISSNFSGSGNRGYITVDYSV